MRYAIFSDVHSNLEALNCVLEAYKKESIDRYLCLGDFVGYASNPNECIQNIKGRITAAVAGNHDWAVVDLFPDKYFNPVAFKAIIWTKEHLSEDSKGFLLSLKSVYRNEDLTLVHGTLNDAERFNYMMDIHDARESFRLLETDICFIGHTHITGFFSQYNDGHIDYNQEPHIKIEPDNKYIVNVGSVGQPRDKSHQAAYCIYDTDKKEAWIKRTDYEIQITRRKIIEAGLPKFLGDRLIEGI